MITDPDWQNSTEIGTHLPECPMSDPSPARRNRCLCAVLHACESRVREDERQRVVVEFMSNHGDREMYEQGQRDERERLLNKLAERGVGTIDYLLAVLDEEKP